MSATDPKGRRDLFSEFMVWILILGLLLVALKAGCITLDLTPGDEPTKETEQVTSAEGVLQILQELVGLVTAEAEVEVALSRERTHQRPLLPDGHVGVILLVPGTVRAGIDLARMGPEDLHLSSGHVVAFLPIAEVTDTDIHYADLRWDSTSDLGALLQGDREALQIRQELLQEVGDRLEDESIRAGLLRLAEDHARQLVSEVLLGLGCKSVEVHFGESVQPITPVERTPCPCSTTSSAA